ncbi:hypothetical protein MSG28_002161 [Choristoneura fumiferana]|uniref:Uncharacterized protein n=1 Tax=Choristoneura fumiferana TaxID=7141 RepID=A0ACC0JU78_CHOFU|nr:hypothetical protein MSG28_002161 [Choristoneura fumiferana]
MGRHKEWRKIAKRERRRRIRRQEAILRDNLLSSSINEYPNWLKEQEELEAFEREQIEAMNRAENEKWIAAEKLSLQRWQELQQRKEKIQMKRLEQEAKLKMEREFEQKLKEEEEKRLKEIEEENKCKHQAFMEKLEQFLSGDSNEPPPELLVSSETKPNHELCPFFYKTGCCRFGNQCSRNHQFPGISKVILAVNFFTHFGINNAIDNEYDTDAMLEYEYSETYKDFKDFFYDVLPEFEKFGQVIQFKVCSQLVAVQKVAHVIFYTCLEIPTMCFRSTESKNLKEGKEHRPLGLGDGLNHPKSRFQEGNGLARGPGREGIARQDDETSTGVKT